MINLLTAIINVLSICTPSFMLHNTYGFEYIVISDVFIFNAIQNTKAATITPPIEHLTSIFQDRKSLYNNLKQKMDT